MNTPQQGAPDSKPFEQRARELYREAGQRIDPVTAGRLRAARRQALASARPAAPVASRWLIPAGAFAVLALAALMMWRPLPHAAAPTTARTGSASDSGIDVDNELPPDADKTDPNLYQNLDFYGWLAANDSHPADR